VRELYTGWKEKKFVGVEKRGGSSGKRERVAKEEEKKEKGEEEVWRLALM